jgi:hypothetical protein
MSKKKLQVEGITNELEGASLFFSKPPGQTVPQAKPEPILTGPVTPKIDIKPKLAKKESTHTNNHETVNARMHAFNRDNMMDLPFTF